MKLTSALRSRAELARSDREPASIALYAAPVVDPSGVELPGVSPAVASVGASTALIDSAMSSTSRTKVPLRATAQVPLPPDGLQDRADLVRGARLRILAVSAVGLALLFVARLSQVPGGPVSGPRGWFGWLGALSGVVGIFLVPGGWLSALMVRAGGSPVSRVATRVGGLLGWYAGIGILVHYAANGTRPTAWIVLGVTAAATTAVCLGVGLAVLWDPADTFSRVVPTVAISAMCAYVLISLPMRFLLRSTDYQQIRRVDWLLVCACALLATLGRVSRPMPVTPPAVPVRRLLALVAAVATIATITVAAAVTWPTTQRLPSGIAAQQVAAPTGADIALALTTTGPRKSTVLGGVSFVALDEFGRPIPARFSIDQRKVDHRNRVLDRTSLLVSLDPAAKPWLCETRPVKVTLLDQTTGLLTQAVLPPEWCGK